MGAPQAAVLLSSGIFGPTDPSFSSVAQLCHFDSGTTSYVNQTTKGNAIAQASSSRSNISTAQSVFGGASLRALGGSSAHASASNDYKFGSNDWTIEFRFRFDTVPSSLTVLFDMRPNGVANTPCAEIYIAATGSIRYFTSNADRITSATGLMSNATWYALAVSKVSGTTRMFLDGTQIGSNFTDGINYNASAEIWMGSWTSPAGNLYYDELRISNGALGSGAGRYSSNYSIATEAFPNS